MPSILLGLKRRAEGHVPDQLYQGHSHIGVGLYRLDWGEVSTVAVFSHEGAEAVHQEATGILKPLFAPLLIVHIGDDPKQVDVIGRAHISRVALQEANQKARELRHFDARASLFSAACVADTLLLIEIVLEYFFDELCIAVIQIANKD